jgi:hypothetical protein
VCCAGGACVALRFCRFLCSRNTPRSKRESTPRAMPTPIPAFAPVERPLGGTSEDGGLLVVVGDEAELKVLVVGKSACLYCTIKGDAEYRAEYAYVVVRTALTVVVLNVTQEVGCPDVSGGTDVDVE